MRSVDCLTPLCALALLWGCGEGDRTEDRAEPSREELEAAWQEAQPIIEDELAKDAARSAVHFPCTLYESEVAGTLLGTDVEAPAYAHEFKTIQDSDTGVENSWQADACSWSSRNDGPDLYVWVSRPDQFGDGAVQCFGIYPEDRPESLLGGEAVWDFEATFAWSQLLVCREDGLFFVEIHDGPAEEALARDLTLQVARRVAESL